MLKKRNICRGALVRGIYSSTTRPVPHPPVTHTSNTLPPAPVGLVNKMRRPRAFTSSKMRAEPLPPPPRKPLGYTSLNEEGWATIRRSRCVFSLRTYSVRVFCLLRVTSCLRCEAVMFRLPGKVLSREGFWYNMKSCYLVRPKWQMLCSTTLLAFYSFLSCFRLACTLCISSLDTLEMRKLLLSEYTSFSATSIPIDMYVQY